jgi:hypothetical protein
MGPLLTTLCFLAMPPTADGRVDTHFIGFSLQEDLASWLIDFRRPDTRGFEDSYSLIRVADTETGETVNYYRASPIVRQFADGTRRTGRRRFGRTNPGWQHSLPMSAWAKLSKTAKFSAEPFEPEFGIVRVIPTDTSAAVHFEDHRIRITSDRELSYNINVALSNRHRKPLGIFGVLEPGAAEIYVFRSFTGHHVAILCRFDGPATAAQAIVLRLAPFPMEGSPRRDHPRVALVSMKMRRVGEGGAVGSSGGGQ